MWKIWDKVSPINGLSAEEFLLRNFHISNQNSTIFIKEVNSEIIQVENKSVLAKVYSIDESLNDIEFLVAYEQKLEELNSEKTDFKTLFGIEEDR